MAPSELDASGPTLHAGLVADSEQFTTSLTPTESRRAGKRSVERRELEQDHAESEIRLLVAPRSYHLVMGNYIHLLACVPRVLTWLSFLIAIDAVESSDPMPLVFFPSLLVFLREMSLRCAAIKRLFVCFCELWNEFDWLLSLSLRMSTQQNTFCEKV